MTQLRLLHNLACGHPYNQGVGGSGQTIESLLKRGLMVWTLLRDPRLLKNRWKITHTGAEQHRAHCCRRGVDPDDLLVEEVEKKLGG